MWRIFATGSLTVMLTCGSFAQKSEPSDTEKIRMLMQEVTELKARVAILESRQAPPAENEPAKPAAAEPARTTEAQPQTAGAPQQSGTPRVSGMIPGINITVFWAASFQLTYPRPT